MPLLPDDLRFAGRRLRQRPGFSLAAILTLALGLGANIAIFTLVHGLLMRSLPVDRPGELYRLGDTNNCCVNSGLQESYSLFSFHMFEHLRDSVGGDFVELAAFQANTQPVAVRRRGGVAESLQGQFVSANYFAMLGVRPAAGRLLQVADDEPSVAPAVVISHQAWTQQFGQDPSIVGESVLVTGRPMTVVGVAAPGFFGDTIRPNPAGVWIPLGQEPEARGPASLLDRLDQDWLYAIGRIRPGVDAAAVAGRATAALQQWLSAQTFFGDASRAEIPRQRIAVVPAGGGIPILQAQFGQALTILFVTSGLVLLIASANLANLLIARADRGVTAIRAALGASSGRLMRESIVEGVLLALVGGFAGAWIASAGTRALIGLAFPAAAFVPVDASPSGPVWVFAAVLAVATGVLFSAGPAWVMSRTPPLEALSGVGRGGEVRSLVPRRTLVVAQVALSFVLLSGAGLLATSLGRLEGQTLGFDPDGRTIVRINPPAIAGERERLVALYDEARERLLGIPGVSEVSYALYSPMEGNNWSGPISIAGRPFDPARPDVSSWNRVGPRYFETTGTRLLGGRLFADREIAGGARVAIVNDAFRRQFFEDVDPVGQRMGLRDGSHGTDFEIVGVVDDVRYTGPRQPVRPMFFLPAFQAVPYGSATEASIQARSMLLRAIVVRAAVAPGALEPAVRRALSEVDPDLHVIRVLTLAEQVGANFRIERLMARLTSLYGVVALALASLGLYGVTAFGVAQRTREIGVRMALGADRGRIMREVVRGPVAYTAVGLAIGVPLALLAGQAMASQLYGIQSGDPVVLAAAIAVLFVSAALAAVVPARRAASLDPTRALRGE